MFSTSGDVQYVGGVQYIGVIPYVHRGDTISTSGDIMSTSGDIMMHVRGYHEYIGGIP